MNRAFSLGFYFLEQKSVNKRKEFNSHGVGLKHQNGRCNVMSKRSVLVVVF